MKQKRGGIEILLLLVIFAASFILAGGLFSFSKTPSSYNSANVTGNTNSGNQKTLQLITLPSTAPTPTPTPPPIVTLPPNPTPTPQPVNACNVDNGRQIQFINGVPECTCTHMLIRCQGKKCAEVWRNGAFGPCNPPASVPDAYDKLCTLIFAPTDGIYCLAKPVIYLYPTKKTLVDVSVETSGEIVVSDPLYPKNGWKNVLAYPDGTLIYQGKKYSELFYESNATNVAKPKQGIYILKSNLKPELSRIITLLGLKNAEKQEFLDYWLSRLNNLNSKYILFSVLEREEKERVDKVNISPKPDTFIAFIAYFKAVDTPTPIQPLILPKNPPQRVGFTAVEWGGTIDDF